MDYLFFRSGGKASVAVTRMTTSRSWFLFNYIPPGLVEVNEISGSTPAFFLSADPHFSSPKCDDLAA
jgi:hypothetical protein